MNETLIHTTKEKGGNYESKKLVRINSKNHFNSFGLFSRSLFMKNEYRRLLFKTIAENCKLRADIQYLQKQNEILKSLFIGGINETI